MKQADPARYEQQLQQKLVRLKTEFADLCLPVPQVYRSDPLHFRMRAEFRIWHEGEDSFYAMTPPGERRPKPVDAASGFPIGSQAMVKLMPALLAAIVPVPLLRKKLFAVEFLTTLSGNILVSLIYHKVLDEAWQQAAEDMRRQLAESGQAIAVVGRSRGQKLVLGQDYVTESLTLAGRRYHYQQVETGFTQPNAGVNRKMLAWALDCTASCGGDLLELYCGNGNFTLVLAQNFNRVLATEVAKISVNSALFNLAKNGIGNVDIVRMSAEEIAQALAGIRAFRRLRDIDLPSYRFSTVLVDPPRAGLDIDTRKLVGTFPQILYISCNPQTLYRDLQALKTTHRIERFALFDQFPYTPHLECGALLAKRQGLSEAVRAA